MTPQELEARTAEALKGIESISEAPAPAAAPASDTPPSQGPPASGAEEPGREVESREPDARAASIEQQLIRLKVEIVCADVNPEPGIRGSLAALLEPHIVLDEGGEPMIRASGKRLNAESVLELLGPAADYLRPARGVGGSGSRGPSGEVRGNQESWMDSQRKWESESAARKRGARK